MKKVQKLFLSFFLLFSFIGCDQKVLIDSKEKTAQLQNLRFKIAEVRPLPWRVGRGKMTNISKGFLVGLNFPYFEPGLTQELFNKFGVDSWILRVRRTQSIERNSVLGYISVPFYNKGASWFPGLRYPYQLIYIRILFQALYGTDRLGSLPCPIIPHDKEITAEDISLQSQENPVELLVMEDTSFEKEATSIGLSGFRAIALNGGSSLIGRYTFEYALYSSSKKSFYSEFINSESFVQIDYERAKVVSGCDNYVAPPIKDKKIDLKSLRFH